MQASCHVLTSRAALLVAAMGAALGGGFSPAVGQSAEPASSKSITVLPALPAEIHEALQDRDFAKALGLIEAELKKPKPAFADYLRYLKGRAHTELGQYDAALETFLALEKDVPSSRWLSRSRFGRAEVYHRKRDYRTAGEIYRLEAERLLSDDRRDELTAIYLEFAQRYFEGIPVAGPTSEKQPNYELALTYYQEALKLRPSWKLRRQIELKIARCHHELKQLPQAIAAYEQYLKDYAAPETPQDQRSPEPLEIEARHLLGEAQLANGQPAEARKTWQDFLRGPLAKNAPNDLLARITYDLARTHGVPAPPSESAMEQGVAALERFLQEFPEHHLTAKAQLDIAQSYLAFKRYDRAIERLKQLIEQGHPEDAESIAQARRLLGESYFAQTKFTEAITAWREFLDEHPSHPTWSAVQQLVIDAEFQRAERERQAEHYAEARKLWSTFLNKYPLDGRASLILLRFGEMKIAEGMACRKNADANAEKLPKECQSLFESAIADWKVLANKYPQTEHASQASHLIGVTLEEHLGQLTAALEAYKKVAGNYQSQSQQRIANLTAKQLEVVTERKFRTDQTPEIVVTTRNLETLSVKIYRIDMADYFRKMHLATGVETLDIALIDPDKTWEYKVEGYEPYRRLTNKIPIPTDGPGVTAVTVSGEKQEATTMLFVSDLDVIVKTSRNEVFVFAENVRTQQPAEGVSILLSDGEKVFAEELTGQSGVLQKSYNQLKTANDLRVFAIFEGHAASTVTALEGLEFAVGLAPKGYLYTDRPAYRAGELVHLKGVIRWVSDDQFTFKVGEKYTLDVYDARGRVIHTAKVELGKFGTFSHHVTLPDTSPQGNYRVHLHQPGKSQSYETAFQVHETKLEPVQIAVDLDQTIVYRGEKITGKITLRYYYGTPLKDRTLRYRLGEGRWHETATDAQGQIAIEFETDQYNESMRLPLVVHYPERNLQTLVPVFLATRGFAIGLTTLRNTYLTGESFDAELTVTDPAGKPVATELTLEVFERTNVQNRIGERLVATHPLKSDAKTGQVRHVLKLDAAGTYVLRAFATDRFGNRVNGAGAVKISGEDDQIRLRVFAEKHHYRVGDEAQVTLHWREKPALALITHEGAKILGYQLVQLKTGENALKIPLAAKLAPNFRLSAAVMHDHKFHVAETDFRVSRELAITLKPNKTTLEPGEELEVAVTVTDPQGQPVSAELSLALIQQNLLDTFAENRAAIQEFYAGGYRQPAMRVQTSTTFQYHPQSRGISQFLLAEEERRDILTRELAARRGLARNLFENTNSPQPGSGMGGGFGGGVVGGTGLSQENFDALGTLGIPQSELSLGLNQTQTLHESGPQGQDHYLFLSDGLANGRPNLAGSAFGQMPANENGEGVISSILLPLQAQPQQQEQQLLSYYFGLNAGDSISNRTDLPQKFLKELSQVDGTICGLNQKGEMQVLNGLPLATLEKMNEEGLQLLPHAGAAETGYWNPTIITDKSGQAKVTFRLPERSTAWRLRSRAATVETLTGETDLEIITKKDLFGQMKTPLAFAEGDKASVLVEVHNAVIAKGEPITVVFKAALGEKSTEQRKTFNSQGPGLEELSFPITLSGAEKAELTLTVESGARRDKTTLSVPIQPFGWPAFATVAGTSAQNTIAFVGFDKNVPAQNPQMEIIVGPTVNRALIDAVLGPGASPFNSHRVWPNHPLERSFSDVLGGTAVLAMLQLSQRTDSPEGQAVAGRVQSGIASLVSSQRDDGSWSWSGRPAAQTSDRYLTSRAVWALAEARAAGFAVPQDTWNKAVQALKTAFAASSQSDREGQAILLHGLAAAQAGDFAFANRLYRERQNLSTSGRLHLALALIQLDRKSMAQDLLQMVELPIQIETANQSQVDTFADKCIPWMQSDVELRALYLLALEAVPVAGKNPEQVAQWLMAARRGSRWSIEKVNGPAIKALAGWFGRNRLVAEKYELSIFVNDREVRVLKINPAEDASHRLTVPADFLKPEGQQRINLDVNGRGRFSYSVVMSGFVPAEKLKGTHDDWRVSRRYEPAQLLFDGELVPRGFNVLTGSYRAFRNPLTQLPLGERGEVTLDFSRRNPRGTPDEALDYLVITEPIPAGTLVLTESVSGHFERYELAPGAITFYVGDQPQAGTIRYQLVGYLPGEYRTLATTARSFYRPDRLAISEMKTLKVLSRGEKSQDDYQLSPVELYELGQRYLKKKNHVKADERLTELFRNHRLNAEVYQKTVEMLFQTSLALKKNQYLVEYFEIIKEKYPEVEIDFDQILRVALAYQELGEYERGFLVYRATVEARFERESQIAGFLKNQVEFLRSIEVMERLLHEYPAESYVATATYALAGEVYSIAANAASDARLKEAGLTRVDFLAANVRMLDHFLSTWPEDPAADAAAFSMANSYLDLEQYEAAIARCEQFAERYPTSKLLDSFWYVIGYSQFALGRHQAALNTCEKVAKATRKDPETGIEVAALNKWQAVYIMGQIYHSLGQPAQAIAEYEKVDDQFPDADEAIQFFTRKEITLPEVTTIRPKAPATVTLKFRNVASAQVKVYRIDLMKFGLMQRNLDRITAINLAGIKPYHELTLDLGDGNDYRDREKPFTLPLKEEGAYLAVCRGENLYSSGLILVTPLDLEVQEDAVSGRVRVTVKNAVTNQYVDDVHVKTIGSANSQFVSGETDLRGIFIADDLQGTTTVIAKHKVDHYAFYRGDVVLSQTPAAEPAPNQAPAVEGKPAALKALQCPSLLDNVFKCNSLINSGQRLHLDNLQNNTNTGVKAKSAY